MDVKLIPKDTHGARRDREHVIQATRDGLTLDMRFELNLNRASSTLSGLMGSP